MPAPTLSALPPPPTRANPADFSARADSFLGALPNLVTQINALVTYWNAELDTTAFVNRAQATTLTATMTFTTPPVFLASATSGRQTAITIGKGTTQRQSVGINNDGSLDIVPLNGAVAALFVGGARVYTTGNRPTPADIGALPASAYTAEDVLAKLQAVTGGSGSTLDAASLAGQPGTFYRNASNLNAGTVPDARLPSNVVRSTRRINTNAGSGLTGGGDMTGDRSLAVDSTVARRNAINTFTEHGIFQSGAVYIESGDTTNTHLWMRTTGGANRALIWAAGASDLLRFRAYNVAGDSFREASFNGSTGEFSAAEFSGGGAGLLRLNASAMDQGTLPDARLSSGIARSAINMVAGDGLSGGGTLAASRTFNVDSTVVRTTRSISAGNGLTGGGNMGADRAIALGTPGSITADSQNSVTATSHTHYIDRAAVLELISRANAGEIGTYGTFKRNVSGSLSQNATCPGSQLAWSALNGAGNGQSPTGTWKCMGYTTSFNGTTDPNNASLFLRIA